MCLYSQIKSPKTADEDITCYKVFQLKISISTVKMEIRTPYMGKPIPDGAVTLMATRDRPGIFPEGPIPICLEDGTFSYCVDEGYIHTFKDIEDAKQLFTGRSWYIIRKCIIPKGTTYYEGYDKPSGGMLTYASKRIVFEEPMDYRKAVQDIRFGSITVGECLKDFMWGGTKFSKGSYYIINNIGHCVDGSLCYDVNIGYPCNVWVSDGPDDRHFDVIEVQK